MAIQTKNSANPTAGPVKTPSPTDKDHSFGRTSYGANAFGGASSVAPGKTVTSPLADNLKASADRDGLLDQIAKSGTSKSEAGYASDDTGNASQLRKIQSGNVKDHPAMGSNRSRAIKNPGDIGRGDDIPAKLGATQGTPIRKP